MKRTTKFNTFLPRTRFSANKIKYSRSVLLPVGRFGPLHFLARINYRECSAAKNSCIYTSSMDHDLVCWLFLPRETRTHWTMIQQSQNQDLMQLNSWSINQHTFNQALSQLNCSQHIYAYITVKSSPHCVDPSSN